METGFSIYSGVSEEITAAAIEHARTVGIRKAFTSLQIPEEDGGRLRSRLLELFGLCREADISLVADVSPAVIDRLGLSSIDELKGLGIACIRLDYGFSDAETVDLSKTFEISLNASTTSETDLNRWAALGADLSRFVACHNFYPKPYTGLALEYVESVNERFKRAGVRTAAFVPGDDKLRGPLFEGLPTVEDHRLRRSDVLRNALDLFCVAGCDDVYVGDPSLSDGGWEAMGLLGQGCVPIRVTMDPRFEFLYGSAHRDRMDASPYVLRSVGSRLDRTLMEQIAPWTGVLQGDGESKRPGDILLSLDGYGRYAGEIEIARKPMPADRRTAVIGRVDERDIDLLALIPRGGSVRLVMSR